MILDDFPPEASHPKHVGLEEFLYYEAFRIENVATDDSTLMTSQGYKPMRFSPGVWTLTTGGEPLFSEGQRDRNQGLEAIAEMGPMLYA